MAKVKKIYICSQCLASYNKWQGQCNNCGSWDKIKEDIVEDKKTASGQDISSGSNIEFHTLNGKNEIPQRTMTHVKEFDRVCGGGLVAGACILVGGDPGIGKSTLLLQISAKLANTQQVAYISGEESIDQIRLRAQRLKQENNPVRLASSTSLRDIIATIDVHSCPQIVIIDSIQTLYLDSIDSSPGTVSQVRTCSQELIKIAKKRGFVLIIVGHVTKEGSLAGPRILEHMVDTVLYFEGDRGHQFRILRSVKNRFGATDEIGVFEMTNLGLIEVPNPSALFLNDRQENVHGSSVFAGMEGTRPILVEIQALVASTSFGSPRRAVIGWDSQRLSMILAVLETRCNLKFSDKDIFLNIAGGLKINDPSADLAVAAALCSSLSGIATPFDIILFGEVGLSGEIRVVGQADNRLKEASKLGFAQAIIPKRSKINNNKNIKVRHLSHLRELVALFK